MPFPRFSLFSSCLSAQQLSFSSWHYCEFSIKPGQAATANHSILRHSFSILPQPLLHKSADDDDDESFLHMPLADSLILALARKGFN